MEPIIQTAFDFYYSHQMFTVSEVNGHNGLMEPRNFLSNINILDQESVQANECLVPPSTHEL
jgi:hypothetical protein